MFPAGHKYPPVRADAYNIQYASSTARHSRNLSSISTSTPTNGICKQEAFSSASASPQPSRFHLHTKSYRRRWCVCDIFRAMGRRVLRILCFGDSLTSGYFRWGMGSQPYSEVLSSRLQQEFPDLDVKVTTDGVPGDVASQPRFYDRFRRQFSSQSTYDWVIVLGGTNDIAMRTPDDAIYSGLRATWDYALSKRSRVLALTVPENHSKAQWVQAARESINTKILNHNAPQYHAFDLAKYIPYASLTEEDREKYWDDGVHLTGDGYDWMGGHIADHLIPLITADPPVEEKPAEPTARRQRRQRSNDEVVWEEEEGSPKKINQGYVIVRRRDLD